MSKCGRFLNIMNMYPVVWHGRDNACLEVGYHLQACTRNLSCTFHTILELSSKKVKKCIRIEFVFCVLAFFKMTHPLAVGCKCLLSFHSTFLSKPLICFYFFPTVSDFFSSTRLKASYVAVGIRNCHALYFHCFDNQTTSTF